jgi:UDP-N-acetyl-D-glucosamine dehydrogenase
VRIEPGALVVVESTSYPGTTEDIVGGVLEAHDRKPGEDVFLAFSSERMDPGNPSWPIDKIPKVVGGVDSGSLAVARLLYEQIVPVVTAVSSPAVAEMAKLVENAFREVNIALANEVAQACDRLGLDAWEVIDAAATKPFGFMPFYPGPGRGGHCIPSDPVFLAWRLRQSGFHPRLIEAARRINEGMPAYTADRVARLLRERGISPEGARVLVLGVAYKRNVSDTRDAPAIPLIAELTNMGMRVSYHDPHVPSLRVNGLRLSCRDLGPGLEEADCVVIATDHSAYDWDEVTARAACILDCRGALRGVTVPAVVRL